MRILIWIVAVIMMTILAFVFVTQYAYADCIPPRVQGPTIGDKIGAEYGHTLASLNDHQVIISMDDGPHSRNTPLIQNILKQNCISAVFFVIGTNATHYPDLVRLMVKNGHSVGSHSWSHPSPFQHYSNERTSAEIIKGRNALNEVTLSAKSYFRYPGFGHNRFTEQFTSQQGLTVWAVDADPDDWKEPGTSTLIRRILSQLSEHHNRGIILLHENHNPTVVALPLIIEALRNNHYQIVGVK